MDTGRSCDSPQFGRRTKKKEKKRAHLYGMDSRIGNGDDFDIRACKSDIRELTELTKLKSSYYSISVVKLSECRVATVPDNSQEKSPQQQSMTTCWWRHIGHLLWRRWGGSGDVVEVSVEWTDGRLVGCGCEGILGKGRGHCRNMVYACWRRGVWRGGWSTTGVSRTY